VEQPGNRRNRTGTYAHLTAADILTVQKIARKLPVSDRFVNYHRQPRAGDAAALAVGCQAPPGAQYLILGAKARVATRGRLLVSADDVRQMTKPLLRHRLITTFYAHAKGLTPDANIDTPPAAAKEAGPRAYR
jgi:MoxR-like ATPase